MIEALKGYGGHVASMMLYTLEVHKKGYGLENLSLWRPGGHLVAYRIFVVLDLSRDLINGTPSLFGNTSRPQWSNIPSSPRALWPLCAHDSGIGSSLIKYLSPGFPRAPLLLSNPQSHTIQLPLLSFCSTPRLE